MGEFLANGDIGSDAAVEKVMGEFFDDRCDGGCYGLEVVEYGYPYLQVDTGSPGEGFMRGAEYEKHCRGKDGEKR